MYTNRARVEAFASKRNTVHSVPDAVMMGLWLTMVLVGLGTLGEITGRGTLSPGWTRSSGPPEWRADMQKLGAIRAATARRR